MNGNGRTDELERLAYIDKLLCDLRAEIGRMRAHLAASERMDLRSNGHSAGAGMQTSTTYQPMHSGRTVGE
jgi:hypothetical protein